MKRLIFCLTVCCLAATCLSQTQNNKYSIIITNASIVDVVNNKIIPHRLIAISGDTIKAIDDTKKVKEYTADRYIDIADRYILPGLWDMHVHFRGGDSLVAANKNLLPLFLYYGITTVRDCGGDITAAVLDWRKQIAQGRLNGPKIFTSGPKIDGPQAFWAGSLEVETPEQITKALDSLQKIRVDYVKLYDSRISRVAYLETITQAEKRELKTAGHMPFSVKLKEAVDLGLDASEHLYYIFKACSAREDSITRAMIQSERTAIPIGIAALLPVLYDSYDANIANSLFRYLSQKSFSITPTLFISKTLGEIKEKDHTGDKLLAYINPKIQATYARRVNSAKSLSDEATLVRKRFDAKAATLIPLMYDAGINIMAGSDCGAYNAYVYPGESLHEELKQLVASGLTPAQAIQSATINGAKFMGVDNFYGSIQNGKCSDLVVFDTNPLANIGAIDHVNMVLSNGRIYSRKDLDNLLLSIRH